MTVCNTALATPGAFLQFVLKKKDEKLFLLGKINFCKILNMLKKSPTRETNNLSTDVDNKTYTILERLHDLSKKKKKSFKTFEAIFLQNLRNNVRPKSLKQISSKILETIFLLNLWNYFHPKSLKLISSKINFPPKYSQNIKVYYCVFFCFFCFSIFLFGP